MKHYYMSNKKSNRCNNTNDNNGLNIWELYLYGHLHRFESSTISKTGYIERIKNPLVVLSFF